MKSSVLLSLLPAVLGCTIPASAPAAAATEAVQSAPAEMPQAQEETSSSSDNSNSCGAAPVDQLAGFGDGTTGGGDAAPFVVTSCSELTSAIENGGVIHIDGMLEGCDIMRLESDTTILGVGSNSGLTNGGFRLVKISNVILRNLVFTNPPIEQDCIDIESSTYIWVDHCDLSTEGITGDKDKYDGLLDAKRESDFITVSWNKFSDHWKASLIGHSDDHSQDSGKLHITFHHNHWSHINSRAPSVRFGTAHIYSSCYEDVPASGVNSRMGAQVLVEETSFTGVRRAIVTDLDSKEDGFASEKNNIYNESDTQITQESDFTPPYEYTADPADCVCELVKAKAGTGVISV